MLTLLLLTLVAAPPPVPPAASSATSSNDSVTRPPAGVCRAVSVTPVLAPGREAAGERADTSAEAEDAGHRRRAKPSFSAARTIDLRFAASLQRAVPPEARIELRLYTPRGYLYQSLRAAAPELSGRSALWTAALPVAGTAIVHHSLYGEWRIEPHLDGSPTPCGPATPFRITP